MQGDAGVALLTRVLPVQTHAPGACEVFRASDGPDSQSGSRFEDLLSAMLLRMPDALPMRDAQKSWEYAPEPFTAFSDAASFDAASRGRAGSVESSLDREAPPPYAPPEAPPHEPQAAADTSAAERTSAGRHEEKERTEEVSPREEKLQTDGAEKTRELGFGARAQERAAGTQSKEDSDLRRLIQKVREGLDTVRKGVRAFVQENAHAEKQTKLADDVRKLLDLLSPLMPKEKFEKLNEEASRVFDSLAAARTAASKKGMQQEQQGAVQDRGVLSLMRLVKLLPDNQEVTAFAEEAKKLHIEAPRKGSELKKAGSPGEELAQGGVRAEQRDARETFRLAAEVRDQRINDPHSLREAVRVTHRERTAGLTPQIRQAGDGEPTAETKSVQAAETKAFIPVSEPKTGQQPSFFMQNNFGTAETAAAKKVQPGEGLKNPQQIVQQIVEHARVTVKSGMTEMHLTLNPRSMGRIGMHFSVGTDGEISARLSASNEVVRQYLQENLSGFNRDLADAGVSVAHLEVTDNGARRQFMDGRAPDDRADAGGTAPAEMGSGQQTGDAAPSLQRHDGLLDVRA